MLTVARECNGWRFLVGFGFVCVCVCVCIADTIKYYYFCHITINTKHHIEIEIRNCFFRAGRGEEKGGKGAMP